MCLNVKLGPYEPGKLILVTMCAFPHGIEAYATGIYTQQVHQYPWLFICHFCHSFGHNLVVRQIVVFWLAKVNSFSITNRNRHDHRWFWQYIKGTQGNKWAHHRKMCWGKKSLQLKQHCSTFEGLDRHVCSTGHEGYSCSHPPAIQELVHLSFKRPPTALTCATVLQGTLFGLSNVDLHVMIALSIIYALVYAQKLEAYNSFGIHKLRTFGVVDCLGLWPAKYGIDVMRKNVTGSSSFGSQQRSHIGRQF